LLARPFWPDGERRLDVVPNSKPLVQVACICEKVLIETDNVASIIRIVDTYTIDPIPELPDGVQARTELTAVVSLKSGDLVGEFTVGLRLMEPDGKILPTREWPLILNGGESGANIKVVFALMPPKMGLYWLDVLWIDEVLTSIPFRFRLKASEPTESADESSEMTKK
jgi:hypothetical protein